MRCTEIIKTASAAAKAPDMFWSTRSGRWALGACVGAALSLAGCGSAPPAQPPAPQARNLPTPPAPSVDQGRPAEPQPGGAGRQAGAAGLPPPGPVKDHVELRRQAALRMVAANPDGIYMGEVPAVLLAIPVLEIELKADGQIKNIRVVRVPTQAEDTVLLAIAAVHRAAPFGNVSRLPRPWVFNETFLFNDDRKFKPRTLDD